MIRRTIPKPERGGLELPGIFAPFVMSRPMQRMPSHYIRAMHPKSEIRPDPTTIRRILEKGWWAQTKIHGHRAQFHISADPNQDLIAYNRQGAPHAKKVPDGIARELRRIFGPRDGWNVIDAEWVKTTNKIYVFDLLKHKNLVLSTKTYEERYTALPRIYTSEFIETLPVISTLDACLRILDQPGPRVEGLVFKSRNTPGFADTSIIRCRTKIT